MAKKNVIIPIIIIIMLVTNCSLLLLNTTQPSSNLSEGDGTIEPYVHMPDDQRQYSDWKMDNSTDMAEYFALADNWSADNKLIGIYDIALNTTSRTPKVSEATLRFISCELRSSLEITISDMEYTTEESDTYYDWTDIEIGPDLRDYDVVDISAIYGIYTGMFNATVDYIDLELPILYWDVEVGAVNYIFHTGGDPLFSCYWFDAEDGTYLGFGNLVASFTVKTRIHIQQDGIGDDWLITIRYCARVYEDVSVVIVKEDENDRYDLSYLLYAPLDECDDGRMITWHDNDDSEYLSVGDTLSYNSNNIDSERVHLYLLSRGAIIYSVYLH